MLVDLRLDASVQAIAACSDISAVAAPSAKPATFHNGCSAVGRTRRSRHQRVEAGAGAAAPGRPCAASSLASGRCGAARRAGRHRCASRHTRRPGRRAASSAVGPRGRRAPAAHARRSLRHRPQIIEQPTSETIAFQPAMRDAEERPLHLVAADHRRSHDLLQQIRGRPAVRGRRAGGEALENLELDPGMINADRAAIRRSPAPRGGSARASALTSPAP